jgi:hypothetical protein
MMVFKVFCPAWLLVSIGLCMNVVAILVTSLVLDRNSMQQLGRHEQQQQNVYLIQQAWNKLDILERKEEWMLLYLQSHEKNGLLDKKAAAHLTRWLPVKSWEVSLAGFEQIVIALEQERQSLRDHIDNLYILNLQLQAQIAGYRDEFQRYRNVALLLQIFGLALILSRDLAWRR